ncbi:MAG: efflux RND transporter periplasmic adaptor subunit [Firmicutes bacterium]|nr:efflux RND transporter periplasmic adaptor subunit [Bacillota bacterium]
MIKKIQIYIIVILCSCFLAGCQVVADNTISVDIAAVRVDVFSNGYTTVGVVKPQTQVEVISKYSGTVEHTFKEIGDRVFAGDVLLQLDTTSIINQIKSNQATLDQTNIAVSQARIQYQTVLDNANIAYDAALLAQQQAKKDYDNSQTLYEVEAIAKSNLEMAQLALDKADAAAATAKTALEAAQKNLNIYSAQAAAHVTQTQYEILTGQMEDYTVTSPIDGVIINKNAVAGGMISQSPAYTVANIDQVTISTAVPQEEINKLSLGGNVQVFSADNSVVETQITALSNSANNANLYMVQVTVENKEHYFKPGMKAKMVFVESQYKSIIVPYKSVVNAGKDAYIFIAENNTAKKVFVKVLGKNTDEISLEPINADLSENTQIVVFNANLLKDGDSLKIDN